jgi:type IV secretory pathway TraG/TraD family ATPase VirD4
MLAPVVWVAALVGGSRRRRAGALATVTDMAALTANGARRRAIALRPHLAARHPRRRDRRALADADMGVALGSLDHTRVTLWASWEDVILAVMAPRSGKTTALTIPVVLAAPGAVLCTSNKADAVAATAKLRAATTAERVWVFDPQQIANAERSWWWNPLDGVTTYERAHRLAGHFVAALGAEVDFWRLAAHDLLAGLFLAAGIGERSIGDVHRRLVDSRDASPIRIPADVAEHDAVASLEARRAAPAETREGVFETARTAGACLRNPAILAWVTPPDIETVERFDVARFVTSRQTLHLLSKDGADAAAPLVAALTDRVFVEATRAAERAGGRLDPPLVAVLDEAANVCRIADLPDLYSHLGSRGVVPITILQSRAQGQRVWGRDGFAALWSASTVKLVGAGIDDAAFAEDISRLVGEHDIEVRSVSYGRDRASDSISVRRERVMSAAEVRRLPVGTALLLATSCPVARVHLRPWYAGPDADRIASSIAAATAVSTERASA